MGTWSTKQEEVLTEEVNLGRTVKDGLLVGSFVVCFSEDLKPFPDCRSGITQKIGYLNHIERYTNLKDIIESHYGTSEVTCLKIIKSGLNKDPYTKNYDYIYPRHSKNKILTHNDRISLC